MVAELLIFIRMLILITADFGFVTKKSCTPKTELESVSIFCWQGMKSHQAPRRVMVPVLLLVGIVMVHFLYLNPKNVNIKFYVLTFYVASVEKGMHTNGFRYKKCTHLTVGTANVNLNPR